MNRMWFCCEYKEKVDKVAEEFELIANDLLSSLSDGWMDDKEEQLRRARESGKYLSQKLDELKRLSEKITIASLDAQIQINRATQDEFDRRKSDKLVTK